MPLFPTWFSLVVFAFECAMGFALVGLFLVLVDFTYARRLWRALLGRE